MCLCPVWAGCISTGHIYVTYTKLERKPQSPILARRDHPRGRPRGPPAQRGAARHHFSVTMDDPQDRQQGTFGSAQNPSHTRRAAALAPVHTAPAHLPVGACLWLLDPQKPDRARFARAESGESARATLGLRGAGSPCPRARASDDALPLRAIASCSTRSKRAAPGKETEGAVRRHSAKRGSSSSCPKYLSMILTACS